VEGEWIVQGFGVGEVVAALMRGVEVRSRRDRRMGGSMSAQSTRWTDRISSIWRYVTTQLGDTRRIIG